MPPKKVITKPAAKASKAATAKQASPAPKPAAKSFSAKKSTPAASVVRSKRESKPTPKVTTADPPSSRKRKEPPTPTPPAKKATPASKPAAKAKAAEPGKKASPAPKPAAKTKAVEPAKRTSPSPRPAAKAKVPEPSKASPSPKHAAEPAKRTSPAPKPATKAKTSDPAKKSSPAPKPATKAKATEHAKKTSPAPKSAAKAKATEPSPGAPKPFELSLNDLAMGIAKAFGTKSPAASKENPAPKEKPVEILKEKAVARAVAKAVKAAQPKAAAKTAKPDAKAAQAKPAKEAKLDAKAAKAMKPAVESVKPAAKATKPVAKPAKAPPAKAAPARQSPAKTITKKVVAKPEKNATKKERKRSKPEPEYLEVQSISGIKYKGGKILYHINWVGGDSTWEPEANIGDDDLVDEFEEAQQKLVFGKQKIGVGDVVEVKNTAEGFQNSWTGAKVLRKAGKSDFEVEYTNFVDSKGKKLADKVEKKLLRLCPGASPKGWSPVLGEIVEVQENDCWWEAQVKELKAKSAMVKFRVSDEETLVPLKMIRPCNWLIAAINAK